MSPAQQGCRRGDKAASPIVSAQQGPLGLSLAGAGARRSVGESPLRTTFGPVARPD